MRRYLVLACLCSISVATVAQDSLSLVMGRFDPTKHPEFSLVPSEMATKDGMYIRTEALEAFSRMRKEAQKDGITLTIVSATRNFDDQKRIWESKWNGSRKVNGQNLSVSMPDQSERAREILKYSSMPGTSRHHWGTDIDINSVNPSYFETGKGKTEYEWLRDNAHRFGFCQTYTSKDADRPVGYDEEKWHWSYLPISIPMLRYYSRNVKAVHVAGFDGCTALPFEEVKRYVQGISPLCK